MPTLEESGRETSFSMGVLTSAPTCEPRWDAGAKTIVAIDPSPEALWSLHRNFAKEIAAGKVIVYEKGIWDEEKTLVLYANGNGAAGDNFLAEGLGARKIPDIPVTTIDRIVEELDLPRVDIIKADIKGAAHA